MGVRSVMVVFEVGDVFCYTIDQRHCADGLPRVPHLCFVLVSSSFSTSYSPWFISIPFYVL